MNVTILIDELSACIFQWFFIFLEILGTESNPIIFEKIMGTGSIKVNSYFQRNTENHFWKVIIANKILIKL